MSEKEEKIYTLEELEEKLTEKERIFCHEYIIDWNGSRSARKAGYSENTAAEIAHENLRKPHIKQYIAYIKNDIAKEAGISKLKLINKLKTLIESNDTSVRTSDTINAIQVALKAMGWNEPDKIDHTTKGSALNENTDLSNLSDEEIKQLATLKLKSKGIIE